MEGVTVSYAGYDFVTFTYYGMPCALFSDGYSDTIIIEYRLIEVPELESDEEPMINYFEWESAPYSNYENVEQAIKEGAGALLGKLNNCLTMLRANAEWGLNILD